MGLYLRLKSAIARLVADEAHAAGYQLARYHADYYRDLYKQEREHRLRLESDVGIDTGGLKGVKVSETYTYWRDHKGSQSVASYDVQR